MKSGYNLAARHWQLQRRQGASSSGNGVAAIWKKLWSLQVPPRIRVFLWRVATHSLPLGQNLRIRNISDGICRICLQELETDRHCFFECPWVREVWNKTRRGLVWARQQASSFLDLCAQILTADDSDAALFVVTLWIIWKTRNAALFEEKSISISQVVKDSSTLLESYIEAQSQLEGSSSPTHQPGKWRAPDFPMIKVNVDAAWRSTSGGAGAVVRNHTGAILHTAAAPISCATSAEQAELLAILFGMQEAGILGFTSISIESDSLLAFQRLTSDEEDLSNLGITVLDIKLLA